ncbi:MAG: tetratricopeptide repeat protein [Gemmatales bacterium]|nr:tetratricopeptide repeat protein [Gemmatales bacterium]MDW8386497.1 tetratricopeptide repeat protein [Gemmatales bacterium]
MKRRWYWLGLLLVAIPLVYFVLRGRIQPLSSPPDPRLTLESPFLNVRPHVRYVGDAVCASCHQDIADHYAQHSMGQAMYPTEQAPRLEGLSETGSYRFQVGRLMYEVTMRNGRMFHSETLLGRDGKPLARIEEEAAYAIGSGTRGRTYVVNRDGFFFESPISWYRHTGSWDLSPGYEKRNMHFERPIQAGCLFCHCNFAHDEPNTMNRYAPPYFSGFVIGCERCHGPGELHAEKPKKTDGIDYSIVNPRHLSPELREDVCQQCHLQGEERVVKAGRGTFDYRPGLPLHEFLAIYVKPPELTRGQKAVSQVEQMHVSRCFQGSGGTMGCTSCHDPHRRIQDPERVTFYRQRCLACHDKQPCSLPATDRRQASAEDSCIHCHMPRLQSNIAHTALTDHRVLRRPDKDRDLPDAGAILSSGIVPLRHFHADRVDGSRLDVQRDFGVAIVNVARRIEGQAPIVPLVRKAQGLLEPFLKQWPNDPAGWDALGYALRKQGNLREAEEAYHQALKFAPDREQTLEDLVEMAEQARRPQEAVRYQERLVQLNPSYSIYQLKLAELLHQVGDYEGSNSACRRALELNLIHDDARRLRIVNFLRLGKFEQADEEFLALVETSGEDRASLEAWYRNQKQKLR